MKGGGFQFIAWTMVALSLSGAQMVSVDRTGTHAGGSLSEQFCISGNGRLAAFSSIASNFVSGDTNQLSDVFVFDCVARSNVWNTCGSLAVISGNVGSLPLAFTPDGRFLLFVSRATNLVDGISYAANSMYQLYVRDLVSNVTTLVTAALDGTNVANASITLVGGPPFGSQITPDGRYVTFLLYATNLVPQIDGNNSTDVYVRDLASGTTELVTVSPDGSAALDRSTSQFFASTNGRYVAFLTAATNVVPGFPNTNGMQQVYWRDRVAGSNALVSITVNGDFPRNSMTLDGMSSDGRFVCFNTLDTNIVTGVTDRNGTQDIFIRDMFAGETWLVTRTTSNSTVNGRSSARQFSENGKWFLFSSDGDGLVPGVTNWPGISRNIYAHHLPSRTNAMVSISANGWSGANAFVSANFARMSATGRYTLFTSTATNLVSNTPNATQRLFLRDLIGGYTRSVFPYTPFVTPAFNEARFLVSDDERHVFFLTYINYDPSVNKTDSTLDLFRAPLFAPRFTTQPTNALRAEGLAGQTYVLQMSDDLMTWSPVATNTATADGMLDLGTVAQPLAERRFYRLMWR